MEFTTLIQPLRTIGEGGNRPHVDLLRKSLEARASYLRFIRMARLPNEIVLPAASKITVRGARLPEHLERMTYR